MPATEATVWVEIRQWPPSHKLIRALALPARIGGHRGPLARLCASLAYRVLRLQTRIPPGRWSRPRRPTHYF